MTPWILPESAEIGGGTYQLNTDFRDMLEIMRYLNDPDQPEYLRWRIAVALFYEGEEPVPEEHLREAMEYLADFIVCGEKDAKPGPKLLDWEQDAQAIVADVNKVAGTEIRSMPYMHWWTFVSYINAIGDCRENRPIGKKMGYLQVRCLRCGREFNLSLKEIENNPSLICPKCGTVADKGHWSRIKAGFYLCQRLFGAEESVEIRMFQAEYKLGGD